MQLKLKILARSKIYHLRKKKLILKKLKKGLYQTLDDVSSNNSHRLIVKWSPTNLLCNRYKHKQLNSSFNNCKIETGTNLNTKLLKPVKHDQQASTNNLDYYKYY